MKGTVIVIRLSAKGNYDSLVDEIYSLRETKQNARWLVLNVKV